MLKFGTASLKRILWAPRLAAIGTLLLAANGWGSTAACITKASLSSFGATATGSGCYETDQTFSNFATVNGSTSTGVAQSNSTIDIAGSDTFTSETLNTPWLVSEAFSGATAADFAVTGTGGATTKGTMSMLVNSTNAYLTNPTYPHPQAGANNFITSVSLATSGTTGDANNNDDSLVVVEMFCIGSGACTTGAGGDEVILTATYGNNSSTPSYTCALGAGVTAATAHIAAASCPGTASAAPIVVSFSLNVTTLTVTDIYTLAAHVNAAGGNTTVTLNNFTDVFGEEELAPEPSSFFLLGLALAAVAALRLRRKHPSRRP